MWWDETRRIWVRHPDCVCGHPTNRPCLCRWLRPLDATGQPVPHPVIDAIREAEQPPCAPVAVKTEAA